MQIVQVATLPSSNAENTSTTPLANSNLHLGFTWNSENLSEDQPAPVHVETGGDHDEFKARGQVTLDPGAVSALVVLRPAFEGAIENERMRLHMARLDIMEPGMIKRQCLEHERERLKLLEKKVTEKSRTHDKAAAELQRTRDQLKAAQVHLGAQTTKEGLVIAKASLKMFEPLVDSWVENVAFAYSQLQSWELKLERQRERVVKTKNELTAIDINSKEKARMLEDSLASLQALSNVLGSL